MKLILAAVLSLFLYCTVAKADECIPVDRFASEFAKEGIYLRGSKAAATEKMAALFNANREARGQPKAEISIFLFGFVITEANGPVVIAAAADKNGCIISKTVVVMTARQWVDFTTRAGVTIDDFVPLDGA